MEDGAVVEQRGIDLGLAQHDVRAGAAVERKRAVAVRVELDESERRGHLFIDCQTGNVNSAVEQRLPQKIPEAVAADLADEGGLSAKPGVHRQNIRRCAAGVAGKERDALCAFSVRLVDDTTSTESCNINHF